MWVTYFTDCKTHLCIENIFQYLYKKCMHHYIVHTAEGVILDLVWQSVHIHTIIKNMAVTNSDITADQNDFERVRAKYTCSKNYKIKS